MAESRVDVRVDRLMLNGALDEIHKLIDGQVWTKETCKEIAVILRKSGRGIRGLPDEEGEGGDEATEQVDHKAEALRLLQWVGDPINPIGADADDPRLDRALAAAQAHCLLAVAEELEVGHLA